MDQGSSAAGGALSITLASTAKKIAGYYNGMKIENITDDWIDIISDYTAARVATIGTETGAASKYYGIVSDIPEPFHHLIIPQAVFEITGNYPIAKEKPQLTGLQIWQQDFLATLRAYAGPTLDTYAEDTWSSYGSGRQGNINPYNIPGH